MSHAYEASLAAALVGLVVFEIITWVRDRRRSAAPAIPLYRIIERAPCCAVCDEPMDPQRCDFCAGAK